MSWKWYICSKTQIIKNSISRIGMRGMLFLYMYAYKDSTAKCKIV